MMRGAEHHVERKIRLWVVQQERVRLVNGQRRAANARSDEPHHQPAAPGEVASPER
jgi:hypothetical protein